MAPWVLAFMFGIVLLVFLATLSFAVGSRMLPFDKVIDGFLHPDARTVEARIIWSKRVPRTFAGCSCRRFPVTRWLSLAYWG